MIKKLLLFIGLIAGCGLLFQSSAHAEDGDFSMSVTPAQVSINLKKGDTASGELTVKNNSAAPITVSVSTVPYSIGDDNANDFKNESHYTQITRWIQFEQTEFNIEPNTDQAVPFTIVVPEDAVSGSQYAAIAVDSLSEGDVGTGVTTTRRISTVVVARIEGDDIRKGGALRVDQQIDGNAISPVIYIDNTGNVDFQAETILTVKNAMTGRVLYQSNKDSSFIYPESTRAINNLAWDDTPSFGIFRVEVRSHFLGEDHVYKYTVFRMPLYIFLPLLLSFIGIVVSIIIIKRKQKITNTGRKAL